MVAGSLYKGQIFLIKCMILELENGKSKGLISRKKTEKLMQRLQLGSQDSVLVAVVSEWESYFK